MEEKHELSVVSGPYDEGKTDDAGRYQADRPGHRDCWMRECRFRSRNPDIDELGKNKARLIILNKSDLADEKKNDAWAAWFQGKGCFTAESERQKRRRNEKNPGVRSRRPAKRRLSVTVNGGL